MAVSLFPQKKRRDFHFFAMLLPWFISDLEALHGRSTCKAFKVRASTTDLRGHGQGLTHANTFRVFGGGEHRYRRTHAAVAEELALPLCKLCSDTVNLFHLCDLSM